MAGADAGAQGASPSTRPLSGGGYLVLTNGDDSFAGDGDDGHGRIIRLDADGAIMWSRSVDVAASGDLETAVELDSGGFLVSGWTSNADASGALLLGVDAEGNVTSSEILNGEPDADPGVVDELTAMTLIDGATYGVGPWLDLYRWEAAAEGGCTSITEAPTVTLVEETFSATTRESESTDLSLSSSTLSQRPAGELVTLCP